VVFVTCIVPPHGGVLVSSAPTVPLRTGGSGSGWLPSPPGAAFARLVTMEHALVEELRLELVADDLSVELVADDLAAELVSDDG
jgi:hypothetical protein